MCGIVGVIGPGKENGEFVARRLLARIRHRGDLALQAEMGSGSEWVIGTNRLAIISSPDSRQPINSSKREVTLAFNGEIYNYKSFWCNDQICIDRAPNVGDGPTVAEVLALRGEGAIRDFDGMFAFLWVDRRSSVLYAARDRLGIKPLYYAWADDRVLFASEMKSLVAEEAVHEVREVQPGTVLALQLLTTCRPVFLREKRYFDFRENRATREPGELLQALDESIRLQCAYSGKIGVYLSGGVDSGGVYGLAKRHTPDLVPLILARSGGTDGEFAIRQSKEQGDDPVVGVCPSEYDLFSTVRETIRVSESFEPNVVRQSSIQLHIAKLAVLAGVRVVLCGEGADELFCGYPDFVNRFADWQDLRSSFLQSLERTQLQRVDRASMSLTTEVRVPYLCNDVIEIALSIRDRNEFILEGAEPGHDNKRCLRAALTGLIPDWVRLRPKVVLSEGLGLGSNHPTNGMFSQFVCASITESQSREIQMQFPEWHLKSREEAYYFSIFEEFKYSKAKFMTRRVRANLVPSL